MSLYVARPAKVVHQAVPVSLLIQSVVTFKVRNLFPASRTEHLQKHTGREVPPPRCFDGKAPSPSLLGGDLQPIAHAQVQTSAGGLPEIPTEAGVVLVPSWAT